MSESNTLETKAAAPLSTSGVQSKWTELFGLAKTKAFDATKVEFIEGALVAFEGAEKKAELPFKEINSAFFSPSDNNQLDIFVFYSEKPGIRIYKPMYMGTVRCQSAPLKQAETVLHNLGIKYVLPNR